MQGGEEISNGHEERTNGENQQRKIRNTSVKKKTHAKHLDGCYGQLERHTHTSQPSNRTNTGRIYTIRNITRMEKRHTDTETESEEENC